MEKDCNDQIDEKQWEDQPQLDSRKKRTFFGSFLGKAWLIACFFIAVGLLIWIYRNDPRMSFVLGEPKFVTVGEEVRLAKFQKKEQRRVEKIVQKAKKINPLQEKLEKPKPGEWLAIHREGGQPFSQYVRIDPVRITEKKKFLYVQPIGKFKGKQQEILKKSCEFLGIYYGCKIKILPKITDEGFPKTAVRNNPYQGQKQLLTKHILYKVLRPKLPKDAVGLIAFTDIDLWPGRGWNFVFGQASFEAPVGVWSLARHGDPEKEYTKCLNRSLKVATHETGHMFSMAHCIYYRCNMQGSNSLPESDRQPMTLCSHCLAKLMYSTKVDPVDRYKKLIEFCKKNKLEKPLKRYQRLLEVIKD